MDPFTRYMTDLLKRERYSMREASIAAGLSEDAVGTLLRRWAREGAKPRPDTLNAIAQAIGGDLNTMLRLVGYQVPETPRATVPHLSEFVERLSKLPPEQQQRIMGHSSLDMVRRYLALAQTDVDAAHRDASPVTNWLL